MLNRSGLLLVGHGTRDSRGIAEFLRLADAVASLVPDVEACFLELAEPTIAQAVVKFVERGVHDLTVMPVLLFAAGHARRDIPNAVAAACRPFHDLLVAQASHLGCHSLVLELSAERFKEALQDKAPMPASDTLLLLVGRGSLDDAATAEMHCFSRLRGELTPVGRVDACFIAMARPSVTEALGVVSRPPYRRVVVQPHLLFEGELLANLRRQVAEHATSDPQREWIVAPHLGVSPKLGAAIVEIAAAADASMALRLS